MRAFFLAFLLWALPAQAADFPTELQAVMQKQEPGKPFTAKIPQARLNLGARGWADLGEVNLSGDAGGKVDIKLPPIVHFYSADNKESGALKLGRQNLTMEWARATNTFTRLSGTFDGIESMPKAEDFTPQTLAFVLRNDNGKFLLENFTAQNPDMYARANGNFTLDPQAFRGGSGLFNLSILGMEKVVAKMQAAALKPNASPKLRGNAAFATAILMMGKDNLQVAMTDYTFDIKPDGRLLANGVNIETLLADR